MFLRESKVSSKNQLTSFTIIQDEAICLRFTPGTQLPIKLDTTEVCDCVCLVIYSIEQGIHMAHFAK